MGKLQNIDWYGRPEWCCCKFGNNACYLGFIGAMIIGLICAVIFGGFFVVPGKIVTFDWIELDKIYEVSKFRSCAGHVYGNSKSSEKHYFAPEYEVFDCKNKSTRIKVYAPFDCNSVSTTIDGNSGRPIILKHSSGCAAKLFHIDFEDEILGKKVSAGDFLGYAALEWEGSCKHDIDISIYCGFTYYSYFEVMTDSVFDKYQTRNTNLSKSDFVVTEQYRQDHPCKCRNGDESGDCQFDSSNSNDSWVIL